LAIWAILATVFQIANIAQNYAQGEKLVKRVLGNLGTIGNRFSVDASPIVATAQFSTVTVYVTFI
jgi:hypothetical protein